MREKMTHGQGKRAQAILAEQGHLVTVVTDVPYTIRSQPPLAPVPLAVSRIKGGRPMHHSTLMIPTQNYTDYNTTVRENFSASNLWRTSGKCKPYPSQQISQLTTDADKPGQWNTGYKKTFNGEGIDLPSVIHLPAWENSRRMARSEGVLSAVSGLWPEYWTQYKRSHGKLATLLGPGIPREYPVRRTYNPLTGVETTQPAPKDYKRISGNRILYHGFPSDSKSNRHTQELLG